VTVPRRDLVGPLIRARFPVTTRAMTAALWLAFALHLTAQLAWWSCAYSEGAEWFNPARKGPTRLLLYSMGIEQRAAVTCAVEGAWLRISVFTLLALCTGQLLLGTGLSLVTPQVVNALEWNRRTHAPHLSPLRTVVFGLLSPILYLTLCGAVSWALQRPVVDSFEALSVAIGLAAAVLLVHHAHAAVGAILPYAIHLWRYGRPPEPLTLT